MEKENVKQNLSKIIIVALIIFSIVGGAIFAYKKTHDKGGGNSTGNLENFGYSVAKGKYIYHVALDDKMENTNIYRTNIDTYETETIFQGEYDIRSLNIVGDELYFVNVKLQEASAEAEASYTKNEICKMKLDGSDFVVLNDAQMSNAFSDMYIIKNEIYYVGDDQNVHKMDLDGNNRILVQETGTGFLTMNEKYIIYNKENLESGEYITYINELARSNERAVNGGEIYSPCIYEENIYYINVDQQMVKISLKDGQEEIVDHDFVYAINFDDTNVYYLKQENAEAKIGIYKRNLANGETVLMKEMSHYTSFINVVNGYIYYMDIDDYSSYIRLVDINSLEEVNLHEWKYDNFAEEE